MTTVDDDSFAVIEPCAPADRREALSLAFNWLSPDDRERHVVHTLTAAETNPRAMAGLLVARRHGALCGAILVDVQPGRAALLHLPGTAGNAPCEKLAARLIVAAIEYCHQQGVRLVQSLLETDAEPGVRALAEAGLRHTVDLLYLVSTQDHFPESPPRTSLEFEPFVPGDETRLSAVIERTYVDSRDCPALDGTRAMSDVIEGYRHTGAHESTRWFFVRQAADDVGCLLLCDHPQHDQWELVYMGLVPEVRGRTLGMDVARYAQWQTRCAARGKLVLAVDADNEPALNMYAASGFFAWDRRSVFVRVLES